MMSIALAIFAVIVALIYFERLNPLRYKKHDKVFVVMNVLMCCGCIWSAYALCVLGLAVLNVLVPVIAALYLVRSHEVFVRQTQTGDLDHHDDMHFYRGH